MFALALPLPHVGGLLPLLGVAAGSAPCKPGLHWSADQYCDMVMIALEC